MGRLRWMRGKTPKSFWLHMWIPDSHCQGVRGCTCVRQEEESGDDGEEEENDDDEEDDNWLEVYCRLAHTIESDRV
jgi:hypothetical protein